MLERIFENGVDGRAAACELRALLDEPVRAACSARCRSGHGRLPGAAMCFVCALYEQLHSRRAVIGPCICEPAECPSQCRDTSFLFFSLLFFFLRCFLDCLGRCVSAWFIAGAVMQRWSGAQCLCAETGACADQAHPVGTAPFEAAGLRDSAMCCAGAVGGAAGMGGRLM